MQLFGLGLVDSIGVLVIIIFVALAFCVFLYLTKMLYIIFYPFYKCYVYFDPCTIKGESEYENDEGCLYMLCCDHETIV